MASTPRAAPAHRLVAALAACALGLPALPARADGSIRCGGSLVSVGDRKIDLLGRCGPPDHQEAHDEERAFTFRGPGNALHTRRVLLTVERWTYDFGPSRFLQWVTMESGTITAVEQGSYGTAAGDQARRGAPLPRARCDTGDSRVGDTAYEVQVKCGEPALRDGKSVARSVVVPLGTGVAEEVRPGTLEVWSYDFGPGSFVRFLVFLDGKLVEVKTGAYGYSQ